MRLLITINDSPASVDALQLGAQIAFLTDIPPTILTVIRSERERPRAEALLQQARDLFVATGLDVKSLIRMGHLDDEVMHEASDGKYEILVIGDVQLSRLRQRVWGAVSERLARQAPCSLLIAKGPGRAIRKVLFCDSGFVQPPLLERFVASGLGKLTGRDVRVTVLHVMSQITAAPGLDDSDLEADAEELMREQTPEGEWLQQDVRMLRQRGGHPLPKIRHGLVVKEILEEARSGDYDLVVIGAHRGQGWQRFLLDDIAQQIIAQVDRPMLVVR